MKTFGILISLIISSFYGLSQVDVVSYEDIKPYLTTKEGEKISFEAIDFKSRKVVGVNGTSETEYEHENLSSAVFYVEPNKNDSVPLKQVINVLLDYDKAASKDAPKQYTVSEDKKIGYEVFFSDGENHILLMPTEPQGLYNSTRTLSLTGGQRFESAGVAVGLGFFYFVKGNVAYDLIQMKNHREEVYSMVLETFKENEEFCEKFNEIVALGLKKPFERERILREIRMLYITGYFVEL